MGLSMSYISQLEKEKRTPSDAVLTLVRMLETQADIKWPASPLPQGSYSLLSSPSPLLQEEASTDYQLEKCRMIPLVSWAHAGEAENYEELPKSWQKQVPTECRDPNAYGLELRGDSMEGTTGRCFQEGDVLIVSPSTEPFNGCLAVVRFANDGILFRRYELNQGKIRLVPLNHRYETTEHEPESITWIHPVFGRWTQIL